jgi:hypothetical protein
MSLIVATAGDQGQTLPVVLGVGYIQQQQQPEASFKIVFEDKADLSTSGAQELVKLQVIGGNEIEGSSPILQHLHKNVLKQKSSLQMNMVRYAECSHWVLYIKKADVNF